LGEISRALRWDSQLFAMLRFHVDSTKRGQKNLCKTGQVSGLRQTALSHPDLRRHSWGADLVRTRWDYFLSRTSRAESFRATWGSKRKAPENMIQAIPAATPQVGQGTEDICLRVSLSFFT